MRKRKKIKSRFSSNIKYNKILFLIIKIIIWLFIIYNAVFMFQTTILKRNYFKIFNLAVFSLDNNSMEDELCKNSLIIMKKIKFDDIKEGSIVGYDTNKGIRISKVIEISIKDGKKELITKDEKNYYPNIEKIDNSNTIWMLAGSVKVLGIFLKILQSKVITFFVFVILILKFIFNIHKYSNQKLRKIKLYYTNNHKY